MQKKQYLIDSFYFLKELFERHLGDRFEFTFSPFVYAAQRRALFYIPYNIFRLAKLYATGVMRSYDVVHLNRAEAFFMFKKLPRQVSIFEIHGFDVGVLGRRYLTDLHNPLKRCIGMVFDRLFSPRIMRNIGTADIFYCSTPDLVEPIREWCGREPAWLPNPIDTELFTPDGPVEKLHGNPACFLAARVHGDKKPEVAIELFRNYILPRYPEAALHLLSTGELAEKYRRELADSRTYVWHGYMQKPELVAKLRGADLVFGDFSIGALSLLPLQVMLLKRPIVTLDRYEVIKKELEELPELSLRLLEDEPFRAEYVERNYRYVIETHDGKAIAEKHFATLQGHLASVTMQQR